MTARVAVITGGARGIGLAVAGRLVRDGLRVVLWDRDGAAATAAAAAIGPAAATREVDVTDEASVGDAAAAAGPVDVLVNNAGITGGNRPTWELPTAEWRRVLEVNLTGAFLVTRALVPGMVARGWGRVVNVASVAGKEGNPNAAHYSASKAGLIALTKSMGKELARTGVLVNCITPAAARTELFEQMTAEQVDWMLGKIPMGRFIDVAEIAAMAGWLASPECSASTGAVFDISGGRATY